ncbi:MAG: aminotransferase class I/II-fold pyridoxal phosphate-dependent enzyme [Maribacter sp.]
MIHSIDSFPGRTFSTNGKSYLYFGGTSYLGLQTDEVFQNLFIENLKKYGTNYGASRKANVQISIYEQAESYLANLVGSESAITVSSGYLAGQLVAQTLHTSDYEFFYAPDSHSAMHIPSKKPYNNFDNLNKALRNHTETAKSIPVLFIDSIDIQGNAFPNFNGIRELPLEDIVLVIDDSHGIGIVGDQGSGSYKSALKLNAKEVMVCCSLGKGFGVQAGAILGSKNRIEQFKNTDFFGGASPATPAALATFLEGESIIREKRKLLKQYIQEFVNLLKKPELFSFQKNYPVFYFSNPQIAYFLEKNNVLITNFNYPNEHSPLMSRIVLSAVHHKEDIELLTNLLNSY